MPGEKQTRPSFNHSQVAAFRMARHHLLGDPRADLATVCSHVGGIQSQLPSAAELQFWARMPGLKKGEIQSALEQHRTLVKSSLMRQTIHLVPAAEFNVYISALKNSRRAAILRVMSRLNITPKEGDALSDLVVEALAAGPLTHGEIKKSVLPKVGKKIRTWMSLVALPFRLAIVEGLICYGPRQGAEITYALTDQWLPKQKAVSTGDAQKILLTVFLKAYGPARVQDFVKWSGISMKEAKPLWDSMRDEMTEVSVEGEANRCLRKSLPQLKDDGFSRPVLRLLPHFDPYLLAHASKDHLVGEKHFKRIYRASAWISPVVLLNGRVAGIWSSSIDSKSLAIKVELFEKLSAVARTQLHEEATRLGGFLGKSSRVSVSQ
jgi:uncharacterized protein YcaQ